MTESRADVIIVGSGISALVSAALLAKKGKSVIVLEQYSKPGGYMHSFKRFGETFDSGAHYAGSLSKGQPFRVLLEYLGVINDSNFNDFFFHLDKEAFDVLKFPEGEIHIPEGHENVISELSATFPNERAAIRAYFDEVKRVVEFFPTYVFDDEMDPMKALGCLETPLKSFVESLTGDRRLQGVLYAYCNLYGVEPQDSPFGFHAIVTDSLLQGSYGMRGGGDRLVNRFVDVITQAGGKVLTKHRVTQFKLNDRTLKEVVCENGAVFSGEWVISTLHPRATFRLLENDRALTPAFRERIAGLRESQGIFGIYAKTQGSQGLKPSRNYYYFKSSDPRAMFAPFAADEEPPVVFASSAARDRELNQGPLPVSFLSPTYAEWFHPWVNEPYGKRSDGYAQLKNQLADKALALVSRYDADLVSGIANRATSTPLTNSHFNGSHEGSAYGIYHSIQNTGGRAIGPRTKITNLLVAGQNYLFPGLLGAAISGLRTSANIVGMKPILKELKEMRFKQ
jgi:all-trans-retinol 13,14-reductase